MADEDMLKNVTIRDIKYEIDSEPIEKVIAFLSQAENEARANGFTNLRIDVGEEYDYAYEDDYAYIHLLGDRPMTDDEKVRRDEDAARRKAWQDKRNADEFERLRKKFGDK